MDELLINFLDSCTDNDLYRINITAFPYVCFYDQQGFTKIMFTFDNSEFNLRLKSVLKNYKSICVPVNNTLIRNKLKEKGII